MKIMDPEERFERIERNLEFLAASQAQHDARMAEISKQQSEISRQQAEHVRHLDGHLRLIQANSSQIQQLADLTLPIGRIVEEQARRMDRTDERLNTLINLVERYFNNGKN